MPPYLKRYLGIPFLSNNKMTHFICQTEPLLNIITRQAFQKSLSIVLPPSIPPIDFPQIDIPIYEPFKIIPSDFWRGRQIQKIPLNRDFRKKNMLEVFDSRHYINCNDTSYYVLPKHL